MKRESSRCFGRRIRLLPLLLVGVVLVQALPAEAAKRPEAALEGMDLRIRPGDLRVPAVPLLLRPLATQASELLPFELELPSVVEATDQVERTSIPNRRRGDDGAPVSGEGGILEDLLENNTIPLFRLTVEPPF